MKIEIKAQDENGITTDPLVLDEDIADFEGPSRSV